MPVGPPAPPEAGDPAVASQEVQASSGALPALLDEAPCGYLSFTVKGTITAVNATLARMLGYEPRDIMGVQVRTLFTAPTQIFIQTHFYPMMRLHHHAEEIYLTLRSKSGEPITRYTFRTWSMNLSRSCGGAPSRTR